MEGGYQTVEDNLDVEKNKKSYLSNSLVQTAMGLSMLCVGAVVRKIYCFSLIISSSLTVECCHDRIVFTLSIFNTLAL